MRAKAFLVILVLPAVVYLCAAMQSGPDLVALPKGPINHIEYDMETGGWTSLDPADRLARALTSVWSSTYAAFWVLRGNNLVWLDSGDIADGARVDEFNFAYTSLGSDGCDFLLDAEVVFYVSENGRNSRDRVPIASFQMTLPSVCFGQDPNCDNSFTVAHVKLAQPFILSGPDLDPNGFDPADPNGFIPICGNGFGMTDFGYSFYFPASAPITLVGPVVAWANPDNPPCTAPGIRDDFDRFTPDPNNTPGPGEPMLPGVNARYTGTFNLDQTPSDPFAQFYMELFTNDPGVPCPNTGCETADIEPGGGDCDVDLADLSVLLANFGTQAGATRDDGDIEPAGGDGDIDLADLALLLADFGADCN